MFNLQIFEVSTKTLIVISNLIVCEPRPEKQEKEKWAVTEFRKEIEENENISGMENKLQDIRMNRHLKSMARMRWINVKANTMRQKTRMILNN